MFAFVLDRTGWQFGIESLGRLTVFGPVRRYSARVICRRL